MMHTLFLGSGFKNGFIQQWLVDHFVERYYYVLYILYFYYCSVWYFKETYLLTYIDCRSTHVTCEEETDSNNTMKLKQMTLSSSARVLLN